MQRMTAPQLAARLEQAQPLLLDVREPWEFDICHIAGSSNIPMAQIPHSLERLRQAAEIVVICHHGIRSQHVIRFLQPSLDSDLINLDGGVDAWAREVDRDMPLY